MWRSDVRGVITYANAAWKTVLGVPASDIVGRRMAEIVAPEQVAQAEAAMATVLGGESLREQEMAFAASSGATVHVLTSLTPLRDADGVVTGHGGVAQDITERRGREDALRQSEARCRQISEHTDDVLWAMSLPGTKFTYVSPSAHKLRGYTPEEILAQTMEDALTPESLERVHAMMREALQGERPHPGSVRRVTQLVQRRKDGSTVPTEVAATLLFDNLGQPVELVGVSRDISDRLAAEKALRESEARYRFITEHTDDVIWTLSLATGRFTFLSPSVFRLRGFTPEECTSQTVADALTPESAAKAAVILKHAISERRAGDSTVYRFISRLDQRRKDGSIVPTEVAVSLIFDEAGRPDELIGVTRDISERLAAEEVAAAERERLATTLRSIGDGVITTDTSGRVMIVNKVAEELTGWSQGEVLGKPLASVLRLIDEATCAPREDPVAWVLAHNERVELANHTVLVSRDGTERVISDSAAPITSSGGATLGVVLVFRDMTEKLRLLEAAQRADKLDALGILAGGIAHDFNNLLSGLFGYVDLARRATHGNTEAQECLDGAASAFSRARDLTQQLLTFAKGGQPVKRVGDVGRVVAESSRFALSGARIGSELAIAPDLWPCAFDEGQLGQVIDNVVINARQAMPAGGAVTITAANATLEEGQHPSLRAGRYVKVSVSDTGVGIPSKLLRRVFDPFFSTKQSGSGLGLATCYSIMQKHDGSIDVESEHGRGTTFHIFLPATTARAVGPAGTPAPTHKGSGHVLVMDDESFIRRLVGKMLSRMGYTVLEAADGDEALSVLVQADARGDRVVLALLDLTVPGRTGGREAIAHIRDAFPSLPVFASSGYSDDSVMARPGDFGFTDSIAKPYLFDQLAALLDKHLAGARGEPAAGPDG
jgi:PAS domain S-box-containing protein